MANKNKNYRNLIKREQINAAMEEFFSRGGQIKRLHPSGLFERQNKPFVEDEELSFFDDISAIENSNDVPFSRNQRIAENE